MGQDPQKTAATPPCARVQGRLWAGLLPDAIGLSLLAVIVLSSLGVAVLADQVASRAARAAAQQTGQAAAQAVLEGWMRLARASDAPVTTSPATWEPPPALAAPPIHSMFVLDARGGVLAGWAVQRGEGMPPLSSADVLPEDASLLRCEAEFAGVARAIVFVHGDIGPARAWVLGGAAGVQGLVLIVFLVLYRRLHRHVEPMAAVQRNLEALAAGVERDLLALRLSDSFGPVADAWNGLVRQLSQVRESATGPDSGELARQAVERFESQTLRRLLDRLPVGVLRCRTDEQVIYVNAPAMHLLGLSADAITDKTLTEILGEDVARPMVGAFRRGATGEPIDRQSGEGEKLTTLRFRLAPRATRASDGEIVITVEDVTHIRDAERARDNFLYHVTHELRTPLTNIHAYAETLSRPDFDDETTRKECYNVIISETRRLSNLVEDILSVSQLEVGSIRLELSDVDILKLMRTMIQDNLGKADEKRIDMQLKLPPKAPKVRGDKQRLAILIQNLVGNAIKYTPQGGRVEVELEVSDEALSIIVADTGVGIGEEDQKHVFEKFYRAGSEDVQAIPGTGLGLAIAREIARLHGGDIRLQSAPGKGATFTVELPVAASVAAA